MLQEENASFSPLADFACKFARSVELAGLMWDFFFLRLDKVPGLHRPCKALYKTAHKIFSTRESWQ